MIVSHRHRFIFLKTTKTASTSLELALAAICGPDDIITPLSRHDERIRRRIGSIGPQHYAKPLAEWRLVDWLRWVDRGPPGRYTTHMRAAAARRLLGETVWNSYFKFAFERNPWDRVLSHYHWHYRRLWRRVLQPMDLARFVAAGSPERLHRNGWGIYTIDDALAVDTVYRYEDIPGALADLERRLGLDRLISLPRAKGYTRRDARGYRDVMDETTRDRVAAVFRREIAAFGYRY